MRLLVLQHDPNEHLGLFQDFLADDGIDWETVELDRGDPLPALDGYEAVWVLSGPMAAWQETRFPWLAPEKRLLREAIRERELPVFGIGLGHQLIAEAAGGSCRSLATPVASLDEITLTAAGARDPLFAGLPSALTALRWHSAHVASLPSDADTLANASDGSVQAFAIGRHVRGIQFHVEATAAVVAEWNRVTLEATSAPTTADDDALFTLRADLALQRQTLATTARHLYDNLMRLIST